MLSVNPSSSILGLLGSKVVDGHALMHYFRKVVKESECIVMSKLQTFCFSGHSSHVDIYTDIQSHKRQNNFMPLVQNVPDLVLLRLLQ